MREHEYKTHYAHAPGQHIENFVDGEVQHEIQFRYGIYTNMQVTQMFQETILTLLLFLILFQKGR